ncbi:MAG: ABC transporter ATP-binding protein [Chthonomonas sp.]|nr:ABC transporter ATP-binding protein [Chthonomonas sp.]
MDEPAQEGKPARKAIDRAIIRRVLGLFKPHRQIVLGILGSVAIAVLLGLLPPFLLQQIIDKGLAKGDFALVTRLSIWTIILVLAGAGMTLLYGWLGAIMGQRIMCDMRRKLFTHLQGMSLRFFSSTRTGDIQTRLISDVGGVQNVVSSTITDALSNVAICVSALIAMFLMDWRLTLVAIGLTPIFMGLGNKVGDFARKVRKGTQEQTSELNSMMQENLSVSGVLLAKTLGRADLVAERFEVENQNLAGWQIKSVVLQYAFFGMIRMITQMIPAVVYWFAGWLLGRGDMNITVGTLVAFTALQNRLFFPLTGIVGLQVELLGSIALFERIFEYLDLPHDITERPNARSLRSQDVKGEVRFEHVSFSYDAQSQDRTLRDISFEAKPGQLIALVGPSGAGKTTLNYLVPRLYDVDSGAITIDGIDLRDIKLADLGQIVGAVTQETYLLHTSISQNLRISKPDATQEEMVAACEAAAIHDHIMSLPEGYETIAGERGYKLSGGEKQRLAIARAILKNPRILILDEATSALDTKSERLIQQSLDSLMEGRTTFAIAHRLSTILHADLILVLKDGVIVERGKYEELLQLDGLFAQLYKEQHRGLTPDPA